MTHTLDPRRRGLTLGLASATLLAAWPRGAHAQGAGLNVLAHNVHKTVATGKQGGDITEAWSARTNAASDCTICAVSAGGGPPSSRSSHCWRRSSGCVCSHSRYSGSSMRASPVSA